MKDSDRVANNEVDGFQGRTNKFVPKLNLHFQRSSVGEQLKVDFLDDVDEQSEPLAQLGSETVEAVKMAKVGEKSAQLAPELLGVENIAPGWGKRIAMLDLTKDPEANRLIFAQMLGDLEKDEAKLSKEAKNVINAAICCKISEMKNSDTASNYKIDVEEETNIQGLETYQYFARLRMEAELSYLERLLTWFDPETGEKHEPNFPRDSLGIVDKFHEHALSTAKSRNTEVAQRNKLKIDNSSLLDRAMHTMSVEKNKLPEVKEAITKETARVSIVQKVDEYAEGIDSKTLSDMAKKKLSDCIIKDLKELHPDYKIDQSTVEDLLIARAERKATAS